MQHYGSDVQHSGGDENQGSPCLEHAYRPFYFLFKPPVNLHMSSECMWNADDGSVLYS